MLRTGFLSLAVMGLMLPLAFARTAEADLELPAIFGDAMVLQREEPVPIWGKADAGQDVQVTFNGQTQKTKADDDGKFVVHLDPMQAGGPYELTVTAGDEKATFDNVLIGEVWVASGQSNMEFPVGGLLPDDRKALLDSAGDDQLRLFLQPRATASEPEFSNGGTWAVDSAASAQPFSAVGYYFAKRLRKELDVPVGVIATYWGGTVAEAWTPREALATSDITQPILDRDTPDDAAMPAEYAAANKRFEQYRNQNKLIDFHPEPANTGFDKGYAKPDFDDSGWKELKPGPPWEHQGMLIDGVVWFRKQVDLPQAWRGKPITLKLGPIDDFDTTYANGVEIGHHDDKTDQAPYLVNRSYEVPAKLTGDEKLTIAVRVFDQFAGGGFSGNGSQVKLVGPDGKKISLAEPWKAFVEHELDTALARGPGRERLTPPGSQLQNKPSRLFNGMIAPIVPFGIRGVIWYQGESNAGRAQQYVTLFPLMIQSWRDQWHAPQMPFLFVQLANFLATADEPTDPAWAHLREAQRLTLENVPNTGMAVIIDIGEADNIHPKDKRDVGERLARWALHDQYGMDDIVRSGPLFEEAKFDDGKATVHFRETGKGLSVRGEKLQGFSLAGDDGVFHFADARIGEDGTSVTVQSDAVPNPVAVRYAWANNPDKANLVNSADLPASPFRSDDLPGPTDGQR